MSSATTDAHAARAAALLGPAPTEIVPLEAAAGRVLAADAVAAADVPAFATAAMDGFALRTADLHDLAGIQEDRGAVGAAVTLPVAFEVRAAATTARTLPSGTAARIMTGAAVPAGADSVVAVEDTDAERTGPAPATVTLDASAASPRRHVRAIGEEIGRGETVLAAGTVLTGAALAVLRSIDLDEVPVRRPRRVAVVVTGDELASGRGAVGLGMVRESNSLMLATELRRLGASVTTAVAGDDPAALADLLAAAAETADLLVTTGGVSQGAYEVVRQLLEDGPAHRRAEFVHLAQQPGGPQGIGTFDGVATLHLPGTPVGALLGVHLFVRAALSGAGLDAIRLFGVPLASPVRVRREARQILPGHLVAAGGRLAAEPAPRRALADYARADCLLEIPEGVADAAAGDPVTVIPLPR